MKTDLKVQNLQTASHSLKLSSVQLNLCKADSGSLALCLTPLLLLAGLMSTNSLLAWKFIVVPAHHHQWLSTNIIYFL